MQKAPTSRQLEGWRRGLVSTFPLVGVWRRRLAVAALATHRDHPSVMPLLVAAARSPHGKTASRAQEILRTLTARQATDRLCEEAILDPSGPAAVVCVEKAYAPSDPERACLFFFVTRQLDRYFEEDFEFQNLRLEYERAEPRVRSAVLDVVRSGDRRVLGFFGARKRLAECTEREIALALQSFRKHSDWERLFRAFLDLPLRYGLPILRELRRSGWEPGEPVERSILRKVLADTRNHVFPQPSRQPAPSAVFARRLEEGRKGELARLSSQGLLERLRTAAPHDGIGITAALAAKGSPSLEAVEAVAASPHWLVRLAGLVTGLTIDLTVDVADDPSHWARELAPEFPLLHFWPEKGTPAHLEALAAAPPAAWSGGLGAARRVLQTLIAYRITAGSFEVMVIEPEAFAGVFEPVEEGRAQEWSAGGGA